jgi:hypothetical protein
MSSLAPRDIRKPARLVAIGLIGVSAAAVITSGVFASLNATATNTTPEAVKDGTLSLTLAQTGTSLGLTTQTTGTVAAGSLLNLAPGDTVNRYVTLTNGVSKDAALATGVTGGIDAKNLTLAIAATGTPTMITDGSAPATNKALQVTVNSCTVPWSAGVCSAPTVEIASTMLGTFSAAKPLATASWLAGDVKFLQVSITLPDQAETTVNGQTPTPTVQGGIVNLSYTFTEVQRDKIVTNS